MIRQIAVCIGLVLFAGVCFAGGKNEKVVTHKEVLKAIEVFKKDPLGAAGTKAGKQILAYGKEAQDVRVGVGVTITPWDENKEKLTADEVNFLAIAYYAGCMEPQLKSAKTEDHTYDGLVQIVATYRQLRAKNKIQKVGYVEEWMTLDVSGKLKEQFASAAPAPAPAK